MPDSINFVSCYFDNLSQYLIYPFQGIEHSIADTSQQGQLDIVTATPIVEEQEGVETSTPPDVEMTSPHQPLEAHDEGLDLEKLTEDERPFLVK
jgi:hypothetical protein